MKTSRFTNLQPLASFPIGGIGTGSISLHASGAMTEFEIFNRPQKGNKLPYSFFAMHAAWGGNTDARVLEAGQIPDFDQGRGYHPQRVMGLPRFHASRMEVAFPFARVAFTEEALPFEVSLEAFSPFIPLQEDDSGIPAAAFRYRVKNVSGSPARVLIAASMPNIHNFHGFDCFDNYLVSPGCQNEARREGDISGVVMDGSAAGPDDLGFANNALLVGEADPPMKPTWFRGGWYDSITDFWREFSQGRLQPTREADEKQGAIGPQGYPIGSVGLQREIAPGDTAEFLFVLSWYVPNRVKGWFEEESAGQTMKNHYATRFVSAWDAGKYLLQNLPRLEKSSRLFSDALYGSTLPGDVISAVAGNLTVLTSNTCFRDETGTLLCWEGCHEQMGSCHGTCTHVWNYAQSAAYLFPRLERSARLNEFLMETEADGKMNFRTQKRFGLPAFNMHAAADGQLGTIVRAYREYLLCGDLDYLKEIYPAVLRCLQYAQKTWDPDGDGLLEGLQHNTYDIEFIGGNPLSGVMYLAALKAAGRMAEALGDADTQKELEKRLCDSSKILDKTCFNGAYYVQAIDDPNSLPYQFGSGCLSDQLFGQTLAHLCGLGELLPPEHARRAALSIYQNNFLPGEKRPPVMQRLYVHHDEPGLLLCTWPQGGKPRFPFVYSDEVWTGIEYQVATLLIYEGFVAEGLALVSAVRQRFDGVRRNPFSEMECGFHYARSLASYGVLVALSGFQTDAKGNVRFSPKIDEADFHCFYCDGRHFGMLHQTLGKDGKAEQSIEILL